MAPVPSLEIAIAVEPLVTELPWVKKMMATGALEGLSDLSVVNPFFERTVEFSEENICDL